MKGKGENRRPDTKILLFADDVLIWGKGKKETEEKQSVELYYKGIWTA
jgi:hypothetical protein